MPKIQQHNKYGYRIAIPNEIMKLKGWKKGQIIYFAVNHRTLEVSLFTSMERILK